MGDPLLIRTIGLFLPITALWLLWIWRKPGRGIATGALLACLWNVPTLLLLHSLAMHFDWWRFGVEGGLFLRIPVDLYLGWVLMWGAVPTLAFPRLNLALVVVIMLAIDFIVMPASAPVVQLSPHWLMGEALGLGICLVPARLLARWTANSRYLAARVTLLALGYMGLTFWVLPALILELTNGSWRSLIERPLWINSLGLQLLAVPAIPGLSAVQEFAARGGGTPIPFDSPKRLVTSGVYAYLSNPMQLSTSLTLIGWGILLESAWVAGAGVVALIFFAGLAAWNEGGEMKERYPEAWNSYRANVRPWWPRWRPCYPRGKVAHSFQPRLYVAESCPPCSALGRWLIRRGPIGLTLIPAEDHPSRDLLRLTYDPRDGTPSEEGVAAFARALEHIHLGWAFVGWTMRLPLVEPLSQLLVDAVGGGPRQIVRRTSKGEEGASGKKEIDNSDHTLISPSTGKKYRR